MAEYVRLTEKAGYLAGPTNIGVIDCGPDRVVLIDTGIDAAAAKKAVRALASNGKQPVAVINTHAHADHIGGNAYLAGTGVPVYAPALEAPFIENPLLEPICLTGGASPWPGLRHKFLLARPCCVAGCLVPGAKFRCPPGADTPEVEIIDLGGHSLGQIGIFYGDVLFAADSFLGEEVLKKHVIPYNVDIPAYLASLERVASIPARCVVPGHGPALKDPGPALGFNRDTVLYQVEMVRGFLREGPWPVSTLLAKLLAKLHITVTSDTYYLLYRTTTLAYLSHLCHRGEAAVGMAANQPVFVWQG